MTGNAVAVVGGTDIAVEIGRYTSAVLKTG
jgi:hypothetical protein